MAKNIVAIVQARMGSTRLPGKVLMEVSGKPLLWYLFNRLTHSKRVNKIILATSPLPEDEILLSKVKEWGFDDYAGSLDDLLDRYYQAAKVHQADAIVRITGDCPLIDPQIVDMVIEKFLDLGNYDLVGTNDTFPDGLDASIFSFRAIEKAWQEAKLPSEREHVGPYIINHPELFKTQPVANKENLSHLRWTVDEERDFELVKVILEGLFKDGEVFYMKDIISFLKQRQDLLEVNKGIIRNEGYLKSLAADKEYLSKGSKN